MFRMEAHEGRDHFCETFPEGIRPARLPLDADEWVYGIYKGTYHFSDKSLIVTGSNTPLRVPWSQVVRCSTYHGCGEDISILRMRDQSKVVIQLSDLATGHAGRTSQLYHAMIERWGGWTGGPTLSIDRFFDAAPSDDCLAPNLAPHPGLGALKAYLKALAAQPEVDDLRIVVDEEGGEFSSHRILIVSAAPLEHFEPALMALQADSLAIAAKNERKKLGRIEPGRNVYELGWD